MVLSRRERTIATIAIAAMVLLGVNYFILSPMWESLSDVERQVNAAQAKLEEAGKTLRSRDRLSPRWKQIAAGPLKKDAYDAESQVLSSVSGWAEQSGLAVTSISTVRSERSDKEKGFHRVTLRAAGTGGIQQIGRFLYRIQTATIPVAISEMQITSRKEGMDDLSLQVSVSTLYLPADADKNDKTPKPATTPGKEIE